MIQCKNYSTFRDFSVYRTTPHKIFTLFHRKIVFPCGTVTERVAVMNLRLWPRLQMMVVPTPYSMPIYYARRSIETRSTWVHRITTDVQLDTVCYLLFTDKLFNGAAGSGCQ